MRPNRSLSPAVPWLLAGACLLLAGTSRAVTLLADVNGAGALTLVELEYDVAGGTVTETRRFDITDVGSSQTLPSDFNLSFTNGGSDELAYAPSRGSLFVLDGRSQPLPDTIIEVDATTGVLRNVLPDFSGRDPQEIALSGLAYFESSLWAKEAANDRLLQIDPDTGQILAKIQLGENLGGGGMGGGAGRLFVSDTFAANQAIWEVDLTASPPLVESSGLRRVTTTTLASGLAYDGTNVFYTGESAGDMILALDPDAGGSPVIAMLPEGLSIDGLTVVPEPSTALLLGGGLLGLVAQRRKARARRR